MNVGMNDWPSDTRPTKTEKLTALMGKFYNILKKWHHTKIENTVRLTLGNCLEKVYFQGKRKHPETGEPSIDRYYIELRPKELEGAQNLRSLNDQIAEQINKTRGGKPKEITLMRADKRSKLGLSTVNNSNLQLFLHLKYE